MRDDGLLQDLEIAHDKNVELYQRHGITTYSQLFAALKDDQADSTLRLEMCSTLHQLYKTIDRRRAIPPLLTALKTSSSEGIRAEAARALGQLGSRRAVPALMQIAADKASSRSLRFDSIIALGMIHDQRAVSALTAIAQDEIDDLHVRTVAIEQFAYISAKDSFQNYIAWLMHPQADIRFWAAFVLTDLGSQINISAALNVLDQVVAFDHNVPSYWGWHVDREAIQALETIFFYPIRQLDPAERFPVCQSYLISPAPEYDTFIRDYRRWTESLKYSTQQTPPVSLKIEPTWLSEQLTSHWQGILLNTRQPRPQAYLLDWQLEIGGTTLIGGLHRDSYAVVLSGDSEAVYPFAVWYRSIIPAQQPLYLYEWADEGLELRYGMIPADIEAGMRHPYTNLDADQPNTDKG